MEWRSRGWAVRDHVSPFLGAPPLEHFPFEVPIQVRFRDLDPMGHVNNAVYGTFFEMGREAFFRKVFAVTEATDFEFILARLEVDYRRPARYDDALVLGLRVSAAGTTSFTFEYLLRCGEEVVAEGRSVQVCFDYAAGKKKPLSAEFLRKMDPYRGGGA